jgi:hypothetical protein
MDESYIWHLDEGQSFPRVRQFVYGRGRWWLGYPPSDAGREGEDWPIADGREFIEVVEIVATRTLDARQQYASLIAERDAPRRELAETRRSRDEFRSALRELASAIRRREDAEAKVAELQRQRDIIRAHSEPRDPTQPLH